MVCLSGQVSRTFQRGNDELLASVIGEAFGGLEYLPRVRCDLSDMDPSQHGFFIAEDRSSTVGCVVVTSLPRKKWFDLRHLALKNAFSNLETGEELIRKGLGYVEESGYEYLKATTPAVQPYVDLYKKFGFVPVRRSLRLAWDLTGPFGRARGSAEIRELSKDDRESVEEMIMHAHLPYWDWWLEERGGTAVRDWAGRFGFPAGTWLGAIRGGRVSGLAGFSPDAYGPGEARLTCFCVLPELRGAGIGSTLLSKTLERARHVGQRRLVIYTLGYLDSLPPGAVTYLKSGAKIEGEYLQLQRK